MLGLTPLDIADREIDVAPEVVHAGEISDELLALGGLLRARQKLQGFLESLAESKALGKPELRMAAHVIVGGRGDRGAVAGDRGGDVAEVALQIAAEAQKLVPIRLPARNLQPARRRLQRRLDAKRGALLNRGGQIGARRPLVVGAIEMLRAQQRIFALEPLGGLEMQGFASGPEQRSVGPLLDQRVGEQIVVALGKHERMADEPVANISGVAHQVAKQRQIEALPDNGGGLERLAVQRGEAVHARQHEVAEGRRDRVGGALLRVPQQLLQEQRVAARALDAGSRDLLGGVDEAAGEAQRFLRAQRTEIERCERGPATARPPSGVDGIALDARRQDHQAFAVRQRGSQSGQVAEQMGVGPMQVLDNEEGRVFRAGARRNGRHDGAETAQPRARVGRLIERPPFPFLLEIERVVQKGNLLRGDRFRGEQLFDFCAPVFRTCREGQPEQAEQQHLHRALFLADAEVEHETAMGDEAAGFRQAAHFLHEPRLADTRLAAQVDYSSAAFGEGRGEKAFELRDFSGAPDERAASDRARFSRQAGQPPNRPRSVKSVDLRIAERVANAAIGDGAKDAFGQQGFARSGQRDQARGQIYALVQDRVVGCSHAVRAAGDHFAAGDADMSAELARRAGARPRELGVDVQRRPRRSIRVVVVCHRSAEKRHDGVPDVFVDRAAVADDDAVHQRGEARRQFANFFRIERPRRRREAAKVGEQNRCLPALGDNHRGRLGTHRRGRRLGGRGRRQGLGGNDHERLESGGCRVGLGRWQRLGAQGRRDRLVGFGRRERRGGLGQGERLGGLGRREGPRGLGPCERLSGLGRSERLRVQGRGGLRQCERLGGLGRRKGLRVRRGCGGLRAHGPGEGLGGLGRGRRPQAADSRKEALAMAKRSDAELPQIGVRELRQQVEFDVVGAERLGILRQSHALQPFIDFAV